MDTDSPAAPARARSPAGTRAAHLARCAPLHAWGRRYLVKEDVLAVGALGGELFHDALGADAVLGAELLPELEPDCGEARSDWPGSGTGAGAGPGASRSAGPAPLAPSPAPSRQAPLTGPPPQHPDPARCALPRARHGRGALTLVAALAQLQGDDLPRHRGRGSAALRAPPDSGTAASPAGANGSARAHRSLPGQPRAPPPVAAPWQRACVLPPGADRACAKMAAPRIGMESAAGGRHACGGRARAAGGRMLTP